MEDQLPRRKIPAGYRRSVPCHRHRGLNLRDPSIRGELFAQVIYGNANGQKTFVRFDDMQIRCYLPAGIIVHGEAPQPGDMTLNTSERWTEPVDETTTGHRPRRAEPAARTSSSSHVTPSGGAGQADPCAVNVDMITSALLIRRSVMSPVKWFTYRRFDPEVVAPISSFPLPARYAYLTI